jgi:hypothetical protein
MAPRENNLNSLREVRERKRLYTGLWRDSRRGATFEFGRKNAGKDGGATEASEHRQECLCHTEQPLVRLLLHSLGLVPPAFFAADVNDLAGVVGVVRADVGDARGVFIECRFVAGFDELLEIGQHFVELRDRRCPGLRVETVERFVVVAAEFRRLLPFQFYERFRVPENQMIRELADGMVAVAAFPRSLLGCESGDGETWRHEPVLLLVRRLKLFEKDAAKRHRLFVFFLRERGRAENCEDSDEHKRTFHFLPR